MHSTIDAPYPRELRSDQQILRDFVLAAQAQAHAISNRGGIICQFACKLNSYAAWERCLPDAAQRYAEPLSIIRIYICMCIYIYISLLYEAEDKNHQVMVNVSNTLSQECRWGCSIE